MIYNGILWNSFFVSQTFYMHTLQLEKKCTSNFHIVLTPSWRPREALKILNFGTEEL